MAKVKKAPDGQQNIVLNQIIVKPVNRQILDVGKWNEATKSADRGRRTLLLDL